MIRTETTVRIIDTAKKAISFPFLFPENQFYEKPSMVEFFHGINLDGMSSLMYSSIPPPYSLRSNLKV